MLSIYREPAEVEKYEESKTIEESTGPTYGLIVKKPEPIKIKPKGHKCRPPVFLGVKTWYQYIWAIIVTLLFYKHGYQIPYGSMWRCRCGKIHERQYYGWYLSINDDRSREIWLKMGGRL